MSQLFTRTLREAPADEVAKNAQLLIRAGFVYKEMAGAYAYLPLGLRVIEKIKQIVREEMNAIDSNELIMTSLQNKAVWERSGRWVRGQMAGSVGSVGLVWLVWSVSHIAQRQTERARARVRAALT